MTYCNIQECIAEELVGAANARGYYASITSSSGSSWYVTVRASHGDDELTSFVVRVSDHKVGLFRDKPDFRIDCDDRGFNNYINQSDAIEDVLVQIAEAVEE